MSRILRILKATASIGLLWACAWGVVGVVLGVLGSRDSLIRLAYGGPWGFVRDVTLITGLLGFVGGTGFSMGLAAIERRRTLDTLRSHRVGVLGAAAGAISVPIGSAMLGAFSGTTSLEHGLVPLLVFAGLGCASSVGTLKIARSDTALPSPAADEGVLPAHDE